MASILPRRRADGTIGYMATIRLDSKKKRVHRETKTIHVGYEVRSETERFHVYARMLNPYGASGNCMGFVYNYQGDENSASYSEVVFGPDGIARANNVFTTFGPGIRQAGRPTVGQQARTIVRGCRGRARLTTP